MNRLDILFREMISFDFGSAERIQHFTKVHSFARIIGLEEHLSPTELSRKEKKTNAS